jgi:hypothetical protein
VPYDRKSGHLSTLSLLWHTSSDPTWRGRTSPVDTYGKVDEDGENWTVPTRTPSTYAEGRVNGIPVRAVVTVRRDSVEVLVQARRGPETEKLDEEFAPAIEEFMAAQRRLGLAGAVAERGEPPAMPGTSLRDIRPRVSGAALPVRPQGVHTGPRDRWEYRWTCHLTQRHDVWPPGSMVNLHFDEGVTSLPLASRAPAPQ